MYIFKVKDKEYQVRYGYRVLCKTDLIDRISGMGNEADNKNKMQEMIGLVAELLLAGLQRYHKNEFGYTSPDTKEKAMEKIYDLMDDYEDESTDDEPKNGFQLFMDLQDELKANGFLSGMIQKAKEEQEKEENPQETKENK